MELSLALDVLVSGLLLVTICYAMVLNKKIGTLRRDKSDLEKMAASFTTATQKADKSLKNLKATAENLGDRIEKAQALRDDLMFLTERGSTAADKLEDLVRQARDQVQTSKKRPAAEKRQAPAKNKRSEKFDTSDFAVSDYGTPEYGANDLSEPQAPRKQTQSSASVQEKRRQLAASLSDADLELIRALQLAR
ncbi:MAG: DUF6468 domain-containing protein [Rhodospirillales bacterium]